MKHAETCLFLQIFLNLKTTTMLTSILDNDLYKFTMQYAVINLYPRAKVKYRFINRGKTKFPEGFAEQLRREINKLSDLRIQKDEKEFLKNKCYYLPPTYIDFLSGYQYDPSEVGVIQNGDDIQISIEGYWYRTILWEVPLMAMISELYFKMTEAKPNDESEIIETTRKKAVKYNMLGIKFADFGTRRRFSAQNHELVVDILKNYGKSSFIGSSNVLFAKKFNTTPIGTHAHEWFMFHAAKYGCKMANKLSLENWVKVYRGDLGIALSDTYTTDIFYNAFDKKFAKLFDGVRHDSGDPIEFAEKTIKHYESLKIDPLSKVIVFSDGLNPEKVEKIVKFCRGKIGMSFGIGTNFTNDVGVKPLNMVIKIVQAKPEGQKWLNTVKLSDVQGKYTGDIETIEIMKKILEI